MAANPDLARDDYAIRALANRMGVDINTPEGRAAAASAYNRGLGEGAEDQLYMTGAGAPGANMRQRTPEQQQQVDLYVREYGPTIMREQQLGRLSGALRRALAQPDGATVVRLALHGNTGIPSQLAALRPAVTDLRAEIMQYVNKYMSTYGGANVTENELMRYFSAFGAGTAIADPNAFARAIERFRAADQAEIEQGGVRFPEGERIYWEESTR
jgi:hypothetical protein